MKVPALILASLLFLTPLAAQEKIKRKVSPLSRNYKHAGMVKRYKASALSQEEASIAEQPLRVTRRSDKMHRLRRLRKPTTAPTDKVIVRDALTPRAKPLVSKYRPGRVTARSWDL